MKLTFSALAAALLLTTAPAALAQHSHGPDSDHDHGDTHAHEGASQRSHGDDHGHAHDDDHGHAHEDAAPEGLQLDVEALSDAGVGRPLTIALSLSTPDGTAIGDADLMEMHQGRVHLMIVDEGLEDFHHLQTSQGDDGRYTVTFTPAHDRIYRVWARAHLREPLESAGHAHGDEHGHGDESHGDHGESAGHGDHHDDHDMGGYGETASGWVAVGNAAAPYIAPVEQLSAEAGGYSFTLAFDDHIHSGEPVEMRLSVMDSDGNPVDRLEPVMGAFAHLVGFNAGASEMTHAHPSGGHPHGHDDRGGPTLSFEVGFEQSGVHRLFVQTIIDGEDVTAVFTVVAE